MTEPQTTLRGGPSDKSIVPTADFVNGRNTLMVATDVATTCPETSTDEALRSSGLGTRAAIYELLKESPDCAVFIGWSDEVALSQSSELGGTSPIAPK